MRTIPALLVCANLALAQDAAHTIPFASKGNVIELSVANTSTVTAEEVKVEVINALEWLEFDAKNVTLLQLKPIEEKTATFTFSVGKQALVNTPQTLRFTITAKDGKQWTKEIKIQVSAPERFELFQNYPNPFNPATTISYQLPMDSRVSLKIFNILGQEVVTLVDDQRLAGYHEERWEARGIASGMYVYQLSLMDGRGNGQVDRKTLVLLK